jgi:hypothetical protein
MKNNRPIHICNRAAVRLLWIALLCNLAPVKTVAKEENFTQVSLVSLIAIPEKYDGRLVLVKGIAHFDSKTSMYAIFLTRDDMRASNGLNALYLILGSSVANIDRFNDKYVLVRGRFEANNKGHLDSFSGAVNDVDLIRPIEVTIK